MLRMSNVLLKYFIPGSILFLFVPGKLPAQVDVEHFVCVDQDKDLTAGERKSTEEIYHQRLLQLDPQWDEKRAAYEEQLQDLIAQKRSGPQTQNVITIPVVVHIVYYNSLENIPDSQVYSQMQVLNEDYIRQNSDTINTPAPFALVAANPGIQFCLAQQDPNGQPTTGIERRQTTINMFTMYDNVQSYSGGGMDQWDPTRYFNIWVCNSIYYGKGEFPVSNTTPTYGAVVSYARFGSNHTIYGTFPALSLGDDYGRIACHEIGHCFNLYHINGDDGTACTGTDYCFDTPNQAGYTNFTCPVFPQFDTCTSSGNGIMFQNYMDYSLGSCQNLFTKEQSIRMNAVLSMPPYNSLTTSTGCQAPTGITESLLVNTNVFPDPFISSVTFSLGMELKNAELQLFDIIGNKVRVQDFSGKQVILFRNELPSGIYFFRILSDGAQLSAGKLIAE